MSYAITSPFPSFNDTDGSPLNNGNVYVGSANLNPVTDPIPVYWDEALTQPAAQPVRTINGYLSRNGSPGRLYTGFVTYSIRVTNNKGVQVFSDLNYKDPSSNAGSTYQQVITSISGQTVFNLSRTYIPGTNNLFVYRNGLRLIAGEDYAETGYSQVTLTAGADNGDEFVFDIGYNYDSAASVDAQDVTYKLPAIDSVFTNVEAKLAETVSVKDFGAVGDGITDDTLTLRAARDYAESNGCALYWPAGDYFITASVDRIHTIRKIGEGAILFGSDRFYVEPKDDQANKLYVSPSGNDGRSGLSAGTAFATVQAAFNALQNYGPTLNGTWTIQLAAGTYNAASQLIGLRSLNNIIIQGPSVGGHPNVPTAIIDGTGVTSSVVGMYLQFYVKVSIYDVKFQNWTSVAGDAYGLNADGHCQLFLSNCHFYNCRYAGLSCDNLTQVRMSGGIVDSCTFSGVRLYSQVSASIGYQGSVAGDSTEIKNCGVGINGRISSRLHIDYCDIHNCNTGIVAEYNTRAVVNYTKLQNNTVGALSTLNSEYNVSDDFSNVVSGNSKDYVCYSSILSSTTANECNYSRYWDESTKSWLFGASSYRTPKAKFEWQCDSSSSGSSYNSNVKSVFDYNSATNYHALSGPATAYTGFAWTAPSKSAQALIAYSMASDYMDFWTSAAQQFRMQSTQFVPLSDNNKTLGNGSFRWSVVYAGTGTINTSDAREKQQVRELADAERATAVAVKGLLRAFKFNDAVAKKGDSARWHFGVIAQDVRAAFEANGLNAEEYGLFCYDEWEAEEEQKDEEGNVTTPARPAGNRYGVRYDELLAFIIAAI
jgi:hypothetical protein